MKYMSVLNLVIRNSLILSQFVIAVNADWWIVF